MVAEGIVGKLEEPSPARGMRVGEHAPAQLQLPAAESLKEGIPAFPVASAPLEMDPIELGGQLEGNVGRRSENLEQPPLPVAMTRQDRGVLRRLQRPPWPAPSEPGQLDGDVRFDSIFQKEVSDLTIGYRVEGNSAAAGDHRRQHHKGRRAGGGEDDHASGMWLLQGL